MSTFMFKGYKKDYIPVSSVFIDRYMPKARGEYVKVYLTGLKYCISGEPGVNSSMLASTLNLLETDVHNAWNFWQEEGVVRLVPLDNMNNFTVEFLELKDIEDSTVDEVHILQELSNSSVKDMLQDIERMLARPLSTKEISLYLSWQKDFGFSPELILMIIQYCLSKGKTDSRYAEKVAINWHDSKIKTIEEAQVYIKKHEDRWVSIRKILNYLGMKDAEVMKPQEDMLDKWLNLYKMPLEVIYKACDICFERLGRPEFKYIDAILASWYKEGIKSLEDVAKRDIKKPPIKKGVSKSGKDNFNNYEQRSYDYEDLEKKLLGWDNND